MNDFKLLKHLSSEGLISPEKAAEIEEKLVKSPFSIYWELRTLLYAGISVLSAGLGILIYQNIDTIGHNVLIGLIALICGGLFYYTFRHGKSFSKNLVEAEDKMQDFALLGACVFFLMLGSYLQYQYNIFGEKYGLATLIPAVLFFALAYRFDHRGVLSMGITALASSIGLSIAPLKLIQENDFLDLSLLLSAVFLGLSLIGVGYLSERYDFKKHFGFSYFLFGGNLAFVAGLTALFNFDLKLVSVLLIIALSVAYIYYSRFKQSYIFMLMGVIYGYIAITYQVFRWLEYFDESYVWASYYFMASAVGVIFFLVKLKEIVKGKAK